MYTVIESIATANPNNKIRQTDFAEFMSQVEGVPKSLRKRMSHIYALSGIDYRYSCIEDYGQEPDSFTFFPKNWSLSPFPSTEERNQKYKDSVKNIAKNASQQVLLQSDTRAEEITHVIVVTCTGFFSPGLDVHLVKQLGLKTNIHRTTIGFMGCHAALNGLKMAHSICQTYSNSKVLLICAELCTLHFQFGKTIENTLVNCLFSDGVASAILASRTHEEAQGKLAYVDSECLIGDDTEDLLTLDIANTGFRQVLSRQLPDTLGKCLPKYIQGFLNRNRLSLKQLGFWAVHPGGKKIVQQVQMTMNLEESELQDSYEVLRLYGNMSSPTILFVLKRILDEHQNNIREGQSGYQSGIALTFGPGVSIEGCLWQKIE